MSTCQKIIMVLCLIGVSFLQINAQKAEKNEKEVIKEFIDTAFVKGFLFGDLEAVKKGFYPGFNRLVFENNMIHKVPIHNDMECERRRQIKEPGKPEANYSHRLISIDITGIAAIVKIEVYIDSKLKYTDYLSLYKFKEGWKIVSKIDNTHY